MPPNLMTVTQTAGTAVRFLTNDLGKSLAAFELCAAKESFRKAQIANDYRSQLWSTVNHLETAEIAATKSIDSFRSSVSIVAFWEAHAKRNYIIAIMSIIYANLRETNLRDDLLDKMDPGYNCGLLRWVLIPSMALELGAYIAHLAYSDIKGVEADPLLDDYNDPDFIDKLKLQIKNLNFN